MIGWSARKHSDFLGPWSVRFLGQGPRSVRRIWSAKVLERTRVSQAARLGPERCVLEVAYPLSDGTLLHAATECPVKKPAAKF